MASFVPRTVRGRQVDASKLHDAFTMGDVPAFDVPPGVYYDPADGRWWSIQIDGHPTAEQAAAHALAAQHAVDVARMGEMGALEPGAIAALEAHEPEAEAEGPTNG